MKLEDQVCSLELAKRLKELGVEQNGLFSHYLFDNRWHIGYLPTHLKECENYSAFTVAELGEMLPKGHHTYRADNGWYVPPFNSIKNWNEAYPCNSEADARAKMLIHLLENGLMEVPR